MLDPIPLHPNSHRARQSPSSGGPAPRAASGSSPSKPSGFDLQPRTRALLSRSYVTEVILSPAASVVPLGTTGTQVRTPRSSWWCFFFINVSNAFIWGGSVLLESDSGGHARL